MQYDELAHHGILGQKWGVRRYQNEDGSLTEEGRAHYGKALKIYKATETAKVNKKYDSKISKAKAENNHQKARYLRSLKKIEKTMIKNMTIEDMQQEKLDRAQNFTEQFILSVGSYMVPWWIGIPATYVATNRYGADNLISSNRFKFSTQK